MSFYDSDRNEVVYVPTREELHDLVDAEFFALHPEAPASLDASDRVDAEWRQIWSAIRDRVLARETDRAFYAMFPEAPLRLDPLDSEHTGYVADWNRLRDDIVSGAAKPVSAGDEALLEAVDFSYLRADLYGDLDDARLEGVAELSTQARDLIDEVIDSLWVEVDEGWDAEAGGTFSRTRELEPSSGINIRMTVTVWWSHDRLRGRLEIDLAPGLR